MKKWIWKKGNNQRKIENGRYEIIKQMQTLKRLKITDEKADEIIKQMQQPTMLKITDEKEKMEDMK